LLCVPNVFTALLCFLFAVVVLQLDLVRVHKGVPLYLVQCISFANYPFKELLVIVYVNPLAEAAVQVYQPLFLPFWHSLANVFFLESML
jgi:hypothetical protein